MALAEWVEGWRATRRLRSLRRSAVSAIVADCVAFDLAETVAVRYLKREAYAIAGDRLVKRMHLDAGLVETIECMDGSVYHVDGDKVRWLA